MVTSNPVRLRNAVLSVLKHGGQLDLADYLSAGELHRLKDAVRQLHPDAPQALCLTLARKA